MTIFGGDSDVPEDLDSEKYWLELGIPQEKIKKMGRADNFWGPTGNEGPCGPTTEIYVKPSPDAEAIEIWNVVFNEYYCHSDKHLKKLSTPGIDTGMGLERLSAVVQKVPTVFDTDLFVPILDLIEIKDLSDEDFKIKRIIADHLKSAAFLIADGILPSKNDRGYILRRLLRRVVRYEKLYLLSRDFHIKIIKKVVELYKKQYPDLEKKLQTIIKITEDEKEKFSTTLDRGLNKISKFIKEGTNFTEKLSSGATLLGLQYDYNNIGKLIFDLYQNDGFPFELATEELRKHISNIDIKKLKEVFDLAFSSHQEVSRAGVEKKFGGHGLKLDTGELKAASEEELQKVTRLHTATHLLHAGLRKVLGDTIQQRGSDITAERLRFDFLFDRKLTEEEKTAVEKYVNDAISANAEMIHKDMPYEEAIASGFLAFFRGKYPAIVSTYELPGWSKEVCGGPHVSRSGEVGKFRIIKDEASSAGVRRIRATVE